MGIIFEDEKSDKNDLEKPTITNDDTSMELDENSNNNETISTVPSSSSTSIESSPTTMEEPNIGMMNYVKHIFDEQGTQLKELNESINTCFDKHNSFLQKQDNELQEAIANLNKYSKELPKIFKESFIKRLHQSIAEELHSFLQSELESSIKSAHQSMKETMEVGHKNYQVLIKLMDQNYKTLFNQYKHPFKTVRLFFWFYVISFIINSILAIILIMKLLQ